MLSVLVLSYKVSIYKVKKNCKPFYLINIRKYDIFSLKTTAVGSKIKWKFPTWLAPNYYTSPLTYSDCVTYGNRINKTRKIECRAF